MLAMPFRFTKNVQVSFMHNVITACIHARNSRLKDTTSRLSIVLYPAEDVAGDFKMASFSEQNGCIDLTFFLFCFE